jgi:exoribonuclease-2
MVREKSLVAYKNRPALVCACGEKLEISVRGGETLKVREKDVELIHPGPVRSVEDAAEKPDRAAIREAWELLEGAEVSLKELAELVYGDFSPQSAWAAYGLLKEGLYFSGTVDALSARDAAAVAAGEQKRDEKQREAGEREVFLEKLRKLYAAPHSETAVPGEFSQNERRFLQDVEALALGKTDKSRVLKDLGRSETPEEAHRLLLNCGAWSYAVNPHPARFGLSVVSASVFPGFPPPGEDRRDLTGLPAFAIDNAWSGDPDDAVFLEGNCLWVHVADPAAAVLPGSPADLEARGRGATLYLPEGSSLMLAGEVLPVYALGLSEVSPALSFKITLREDNSVAETEIFPSLVKVTRLSYEEADAALQGDDAGRAGPYRDCLGDLFAMAEKNLARRIAAGAAAIDFPEAHITAAGGEVDICPIAAYRSADMVRECMLLAGEGAAQWASRRTTRLPFPYVTQEAGDRPNNPLPGLAGFYQIRRCMQSRTLSVKPGRHAGLALEQYTQVTSPLRRYTDLLAHQQIRTALRTGTYRDIPPRDEDAVLAALAAGESAAAASIRAERASRAHWTAVYLAGKKGSEWDGVVLEKKGNRAVVLIPALGLETQTAITGDVEPNDSVRLKTASVRVSEGAILFNMESPSKIENKINKYE